VKLKGKIKAWSEDLAWHLEVGGRVARGGRKRRVATVSRRGRKGTEVIGGPYMAVT
jgi:transposase